MTTAAEEKIHAFCARYRLKCEWQDLMNLGERAVVKTLNRAHHARTLKAAHLIKEVCVIEWSCDDGGRLRDQPSTLVSRRKTDAHLYL